MKKSEITVSMPMTAYEELIMFKKEYTELCSKIRLCFNCSNQDNIIFDTNKAFDLCKIYLPDRYSRANFVKME